MTRTHVIAGGAVLTMRGEDVVSDGTVVVDGERIAGVFPPGQVPPEVEDGMRAGTITPFDATGMFVIPGLVNLHQHLDMHMVSGTMHDRVGGPAEALIPRVVSNALLDLSRGITTVRDLGTKGGTALVAREAIDSGLFHGPRILSCGEMIAITGGHGQPLCVEADGPEGMRLEARRQVKAGADLIKLCASGGVVAMPREDPRAQQMAEEEIRAAVVEARRFGLRVAAHAHPPAAIKACVTGGVDTIEHGAFLDEECAELMAQRGVALVPTIEDAFVVAGDGRRHGRPDWMIESSRRSLETRMLAVKHAVEAGVTIGVGTEIVGTMGTEMARLVECGLTPMQALAGATSVAAGIIGRDDLGVLAPGKVADLLVLPRDPRRDLTACDDLPALVVRDGVAIEPRCLLLACGRAG